MKKKTEKEIHPSKSFHEEETAPKNNIARPLALLTQLGISMMVPIFLCIAVGLWLDRTFGTNLVLIFLVLGFLSGGRNVWILAKQEGQRQSRYTRKRKEYDLMSGWKEEDEDE